MKVRNELLRQYRITYLGIWITRLAWLAIGLFVGWEVWG
jgi:hypothetical protein